MVNVEKLVETLDTSGVKFFTGVPDSLLKSFCAYLTDHGRNLIAANEGGAVGLAAGHYLATGELACVYMQNSGQGNTVNPLASLADPDVYSIPMLLVIGWRGMPGVHDEPQHVKQGKITLELMKTLGVPCDVLPETTVKACACVKKLIRLAKKESRPVAVVVKKGTFEEYKLKNREADVAKAKREVVIEKILKGLPEDAVVVSTTGMISREVYEIRERWRREGTAGGAGCHARDFLTVGSMGHAVMIALGIAKAQPKRQVYCFDGDGASIMQMGNMAIVGQSGCANLTHIVLNNAAHDSVGGQPTVGGMINLRAIAKACGYQVHNKVEGMCGGGQRTTPLFVEIKVAKGARSDLGRPKEPPQVNKKLFMQTLGGAR